MRKEAVLAVPCAHLVSQSCVPWPQGAVRGQVFNFYGVCTGQEGVGHEVRLAYDPGRPLPLADV